MYSSAFSAGKRRDREWCYQRIANNGLCNCTSSDNYHTRTWPKSWQQTVWGMIRKYKDGTLSHLPGSGRCFKLTPDILAIIEEQMRMDNETTATQLVKIVNAVGYDVSKSTIVQALRILRWTFHGSRYCQMIREQRKENGVGTREPSQEVWKHCMDRWINDSAGESSHLFVQEVEEPPRPKAQAKHPYKVMVWAGISRKGATNICLLNKSMNSAVYQVVLQSHLLSFLKEHLPDSSLQQDSAPCHVSKVTHKFLKDNSILLFKTPLKALTATLSRICGTSWNISCGQQWNPTRKSSFREWGNSYSGEVLQAIYKRLSLKF